MNPGVRGGGGDGDDYDNDAGGGVASQPTPDPPNHHHDASHGGAGATHTQQKAATVAAPSHHRQPKREEDAPPEASVASAADSGASAPPPPGGGATATAGHHQEHRCVMPDDESFAHDVRVIMTRAMSRYRHPSDPLHIRGMDYDAWINKLVAVAVAREEGVWFSLGPSRRVPIPLNRLEVRLCRYLDDSVKQHAMSRPRKQPHVTHAASRDTHLQHLQLQPHCTKYSAVL